MTTNAIPTNIMTRSQMVMQVLLAGVEHQLGLIVLGSASSSSAAPVRRARSRKFVTACRWDVAGSRVPARRSA
jgi:hypothetical protein